MLLCRAHGVSENPVTQPDVHLLDTLCISSHAFPFDLLLLVEQFARLLETARKYEPLCHFSLKDIIVNIEIAIRLRFL